AAGGQARRETTLADDCPFCAAPLALDAAHDHRHPAPTGLLPFAIDQGRAREGLRGWLASRWFAPNDLKKFAEASRPIQGVYVPHYTYDTACRAEYRGRRGVEYRVRRGKKTEVRVRWYPASGRVHHDFDDVLVPATATVTEFSSEADVHGAAEWDLQALTPYATHYLAGFRAEAPSLGLEKGFDLARGACDGYMRQLVRRDIGGDRQQITWMSTTYDRVTFKHVLLPVWLAAYRYSNTPYRVAINGRTGRVTGQRPYSWTKIAAAVLAALLVVAAIAWLNANGYLGEVQ
ncbi:MAG: primosomal protein N' (replication factor Y) - superfamily II helicase, partial [Pseudomonadota bacterium]